MYYHFDYVGGPRNYKWLNTNSISRVWEQMHLCYEHGVDRIWIVNVGDIKPMEFPISFFLDYAWNPAQWQASDLSFYSRQWAKQQFGAVYAGQIADLLLKYTMYNSRRKPEMLSPETYSIVNYDEGERVCNEYNKLLEEAGIIEGLLSGNYKDAFYQLVKHPIEACANLNNLYFAAAKNYLYAQQGRASANEMAKIVKLYFEKDSAIANYYNQMLAKGKWNHMMDQTHIGYTSWQQPEKNTMPNVKTLSVKKKAEMGIALDGSENCWPDTEESALLPLVDKYNQQTHSIEIFNRGTETFSFTISKDQSWVIVSQMEGTIGSGQTLDVSVDWTMIPTGDQNASLTINGSEGTKVSVGINVRNPLRPAQSEIIGFVESDGYVSLEAEHFISSTTNSIMHWQVIPALGRTLSGVTVLPTTIPAVLPGGQNPRLEYPIYFFSEGKVNVNVYISPTLNYYNAEGLKYGVSIDDEPPQIVSVHAGDTIPDWKYPQIWNMSVGDNIRILSTEHQLAESGLHTLKIWMVTAGVVLQKIVIDTGGLKPSYLGPPESFFRALL
jgi:hypothetical protein